METKYHNTNATSICDDVSIELGLYPHPRIQDTNTDHSMTSLPLRSSDQKFANCPQIVTSSEQGVRNVGFVHDSSRAVQSMQFPCPSQQTVHSTPPRPVSREHKAVSPNYSALGHGRRQKIFQGGSRTYFEFQGGGQSPKIVCFQW